MKPRARVTSKRSAEREARDALHRLTLLLDDIAGALVRREADRLRALLAEPMASHLPRQIREELAFVVHQPAGFRAPIRFLRFRHRMLQLDAAGEGLPRPQLELSLGTVIERDPTPTWLELLHDRPDDPAADE